MKTLVVTFLDLNFLRLKRHDQYEDVGGDGLGLERRPTDDVDDQCVADQSRCADEPVSGDDGQRQRVVDAGSRHVDNRRVDRRVCHRPVRPT